jgi:hypothetical protein
VDEIKRIPSGARLSPLAEKVFVRLEKVTAFPWPVLHSQCVRCKLEPESLDVRGLRTLVPFLVASVARFTSSAKGESLKLELEALLEK